MRRDKKEVRSGQEAGFSAEPTRIDMQSSPRSLDETARQTSTGRRIVGVLASGLGRRPSSNYSPTGSPNSPSLLAKRQFAFPILAVLAVAALGLWLLLPGGALRAQDAAIEYAENGKDAVATFTATDPEDDTVTWTVADTDDGTNDFEIDKDGMLTFSSPPDYEDPKGDSSDNSNTYNVTVTATAPDGDGGMNTDTSAVTVMVTEVAEEGKVAWTVDPDGGGSLSANDPEDSPPQKPIMQFQVGATLAASVTDGDVAGGGTQSVTVADGRWQWYRSSSKTSMGSSIEDETSSSYTVTTTDVGRYLHVKAFYNVGTGREESASLASDYKVLTARPNNDAPEFASTSVAREVNEGDKGMAVGARVTATDDVSNALNYVLSGTDVASFEIDQKTGQIKTSADLDYEMPADVDHTGPPDNAAGNNDYIVTVTATDSAGAVTATAATVTIKVKNVDEKPTFSTGYKMVSVAENMTVVDANADEDDDPTTPVADANNPSDAVYAAMDPEESLVTLSLMGNDGGMFRLNADKVLTFKMAPDYEKPMDRNKDNVYEVTVRATDSTRMYADRMVRVTVTDANEVPEIMEDKGRSSIKYAENGKDAVATFTATDPEDDTVTWTVADTDDGTNDFEIDKDGMLTFSSPPDYEDPKGDSSDNSNTYNVTVTATAPDGDGGMNTDTSAVTVMVTEVAEEGKVAWTVDPDGGGSLSANDPEDSPPQKPIMQFQVGATLAASVTDGDVAGGTKSDLNNLTWQWYRSSSKTSMGSSIEVETSSSYTVTTTDVGRYLHVKASYNVGTGQEESASLASDYKVLTARPNNDAPEFASTSVAREVNEGDKGMAVGARVTATDDVSNALNYVLSGTDVASFEIDQKTGQIKTSADLDYEMPADVDHTGPPDNAANNNDYIVTVTATDSAGAVTATAATVTIKVKSVDEKPTFSTGYKMVSVAENMTVVDANADEDDDPTTPVADANNPSDAVYAAMDPEESLVTLSLMGNDGGMFRLNADKVLTFKMAPDYEKPMDRNKDNVYEVTVRATDSTGMYADRMVMVTVTDVNEAPEITVGGLAISGPSSVSYAENGTDLVVATYSLAGPESDSGRWTALGGADAGDFRISNSGVLSFRSSPNYEAPADEDMDNVYMVTLNARDREPNEATRDVVVTVTDVDEDAPVIGGTLLDTYDTNPKNGEIDQSEILKAAEDYFDDKLTSAEILELAALYFG